MRTLFYKIYRINNVDGTAEVEQFLQQNEIDTYIDELMDQCVSQDGDREYVFDPGRLTTKTRLSNIIEARNSMSNVCAGTGRGQMTVLDAHIAHHKHVQHLYEELMKDIPGVKINRQPADLRYDSNYWLCTMTIDPSVKVKGQENAYKEVIKTAVGGAAGVIHQVDSPVTDCQPNDNVEAMRVYMLNKKVECRPVWKPMHKQPVYAGCDVYTNGVEEDIFKIGMSLPAGPYVTDEDVRYIVDSIKAAIE